MATHDSAQIVRDFFQALASNNMDRALSFMDSNAEFRVIGMEKPMRGRKEIADGFKMWNEVFPDMKFEIKNLISTPEFVVAEGLNRGKQDGPMKGPDGRIELEATHRKVEVPSCEVLKLAGGKITSWNCYFATDVMMKQLGAARSSAAA
jgi:ketosteroid isomerase-like protein